MGGGGSKPGTSQTFNSTNSVVAKSIMKQSTSCSNGNTIEQVADVSNLYLDGSSADIDIKQTASLKTSMACVAKTMNDQGVAAKMATQIQQELKQKDTAGLQWMNTDKNNQTVNVNNSVDVLAKTVTDTVCKFGNTLKQRALVHHITAVNKADVDVKIKQDIFAESVGKCVSGSKQSSNVSAAMTTSSSQRAVIERENPIAAIIDSFMAPFKMIGGVFIFFIIIIAIAMIIPMMKGGGPKAMPGFDKISERFDPGGGRAKIAN